MTALAEAAPASSAPARLGWGRLLCYAAPALPLAMPTMPAVVQLPTFYVETVGLGLAWTGAVLMASRSLDVVTDPLIGLLSDRWSTGFGRRKPWILCGSVVGAAGLVHLFHPPEHAGPLYLLIWSAVLYLGWSMISIPYLSWGAELSDGYHERARITGAREGMGIFGILFGIGVPAALIGSGQGQSDALAATAWLAVGVGAVAVALALLRVPERPMHPPAVPRALQSPWRTILDLAREGPFVRLISAWLINGMSGGLTAALLPLFLEHVLRATPAMQGLLVLVYFVAAVAAVPLWLRLARFGKHKAWCWAMLLACAAFVWTPFLGAGDIVAFAIICLVAGASLGADLALPPAMQADVVDYDALRQGERRAGFIFGLWGMATKASQALAIGLSFLSLSLAGFDPAVTNGPAALLTLSLIYAGVPVIFKLGVVALIWNFPIDERRQRIIQRRLAGLEAQRAGGGPQRRQT